MHTHLKGQIFTTGGTSYLVLPETGQDPEWLRVKALNAQRTVRAMRSTEVERLVCEQRRSAQSRG